MPMPTGNIANGSVLRERTPRRGILPPPPGAVVENKRCESAKVPNTNIFSSIVSNSVGDKPTVTFTATKVDPATIVKEKEATTADVMASNEDAFKLALEACNREKQAIEKKKEQIANARAAAELHLRRCELSACFRYFNRIGFAEGLGNCFSYSVDAERFLINPFGRFFGGLKASDLALINIKEAKALAENPEYALVEPGFAAVHGSLHQKLGNRARCIFRIKPQFATAVASLRDPKLPPICQESARFFGRYAVDYGNEVLDEEGQAKKLMGLLEFSNIVFMGNRGVLVAGETIASCMDELFHLEIACRNYITTLNTGSELNVMSDEVARKSIDSYELVAKRYAEAHMSFVRGKLDKEEPDYMK